MASLLGLISPDTVNSLLQQADINVVISLALRAVLVGACIAALRKFYRKATSWVDINLWPDSYISQQEQAFQWVSAWLAKDPQVQAQLAGFRLTAADSRQAQKYDQAGNLRGTSDKSKTKTSKNVGLQFPTWTSPSVIAQITPNYNQAVVVKHNGNKLWIKRRLYGFARSYGSNHKEDHLQIRTWGFNKNAIKDFLIDAHEAYFAKVDKEILIFDLSRRYAIWLDPVSRPSRPWGSVILPESKKEKIADDITHFLSEKEVRWYAARGIPHRRGYLFHGAPGAGKTTLATAIASQLRLDIYVVNPAQRGMDDAKLIKCFRDVPPQSIILVEDIDCVMPKRGGKRVKSDANVDDSDEDEWNEKLPEPVGGNGQYDLSPATTTLSGLLNAIDGVSSQEGCILIATTNHPKRLDPALSRPGRFDVNVEFCDAIPDQAQGLFKHFYPLSDFTENNDTSSTEEKKSVKALIKTQQDLDNLAEQFASAVLPPTKEGEFAVSISMAALQGYLQQYKDEPVAAVDNAGEWSHEIKLQQQEAAQEKAKRKAARLEKVQTETLLTPAPSI